jgi:serine/threonine-protein kinase HipA
VRLPLPERARLRVTLWEAEPLELCALARAEHSNTALEWTQAALGRGDDGGANVVVRQAPFTPGVHRVGKPSLDGLPGFLADSLPDSWGRLLIDRQLRAAGVLPNTLSGFDRLAIVGHRGPGALVFEPEIPLSKVQHDKIDLDSLAQSAEVLLKGRDPELLDCLAQAGGSAGGSRPKAWIAEGSDGVLRSGARLLNNGETGWLVKFRAPAHDPEDIGVLEFAYAQMAIAAGLEVAKPRLFEAPKGCYFGSQRFDRHGSRRVHVLTAAALLNVPPEQAMAADYVDLLKLTRFVTRSEAEVVEAFRLAAFNVLAHNRDDHLKQFAFRRIDGVWRRTPAYDLVFNEGPRGEHTLLVAGEGRRPKAQHLEQLADLAGVKPKVAHGVIDQVRHAVSGWPSLAREAGLSAKTANHVAAHLAQLKDQFIQF